MALWPDPEVARTLVAELRRSRRTLATCESLTGGLLGAAITAVPGASEVYRGGLIAYATEVKRTLADVPADVLARAGAVSAPTVELLALAALRRCGSDAALALTGVAGPDRQEGKQPGTVWMGWAWAGDRGAEVARAEPVKISAPMILAGREAVRCAAAEAAMLRMVELCRSGPPAR